MQCRRSSSQERRIFSLYLPLFCGSYTYPTLSRFLFPYVEYSALQSDCTHSYFYILYPDNLHASGDPIIFIRQGLPFSEVSISPLSLLNPYSDCVGVNFSPNNNSSLSFLNIYARLRQITESTLFFLPFFPSFRIFFILGDFNCYHTFWDSKGNSEPRGEKLLD